MNEVKQNGGALTRPGEGAVVAWNPWNELNEMRRRMDDLFSRSFGYTPLSTLLPVETQAQPTVDVHETGEALQVLAALPGYTPKQIQVEATSSTFTIEAERKSLFDTEKAHTHRDNGLAESSHFYFSYTLPVEIDPNRVKATFTNGMLQLELPKTEQAKSKSVKVDIKTA